jgi:hypothetical protein
MIRPSNSISTGAVEHDRTSICWVAVLLTLSVFGPYLSTSIGVRTEQPIFMLIALRAIYGLLRRGTVSRPTLLLLGCFSAVLLIGCIGLFIPVPTTTIGISSASSLAGFVNNTEPLLGILIAIYLVSSRYSRAEVFRSIAVTFVLLMVANSIIALVSTKVNLLPILEHFWQASSTATSANSVAVRAMNQGRFTGIFDQPAQAGTMYGLALFFGYYLWQTSRQSGTIRLGLALILILVGGILTVSKIFIVLAIPLAALLLLRNIGGRPRQIIGIGLVTIGGIYLLATTGALTALVGNNQINQFFRSQGSVTQLLTGGRLGSGGTLGPVFGYVLSTAPAGGFGLAGLNVAYDSAWIDVAVTAGLAGVALYIVINAQLIYRYILVRRNDPTNGLAFTLVVFVTLGNIGFPVFVGNRISGVLWLTLTTLLFLNSPWNGDPINAPHVTREGYPNAMRHLAYD